MSPRATLRSGRGRAARVLASAALAALALGAGCSGDSGAGAGSGDHLLLVTVDTLRADHLSVHGYPRETSPNIDAFARSSLNYTDMVTVLPKTGPSMTTHLTGRPPCEHRVTANKIRIPDEVPLLAEHLEAAGYRTAAFVSNPVLAPAKGYARGFGTYQEFTKEGGLDKLNRRFLRWAEKNDWSRPTFVWLHYIDPHGPYTPKPEYKDLFTDDELFHADTRTLPTHYQPLQGWPVNYCHGAIPRYQLIGGENRVAMYVAWYDAEIRYMDDAFGSVLDFYRERELYDGTAIVLTSDHGESLGEHDYWFEHGWYAYEATLHVPMVVKPAGSFEPASIDSQVSNLDTVPTLLAAAGLAVDGLPGASLLADPGERGPLQVENTSSYPERFFGVRVSGRKYLREEGTGAEELYDLAADRLEERNLAADRPGDVGRLRAALEAALAACRPVGEAVEVLPGAEAARQLEALGYTE